MTPLFLRTFKWTSIAPNKQLSKTRVIYLEYNYRKLVHTINGGEQQVDRHVYYNIIIHNLCRLIVKLVIAMAASVHTVELGLRATQGRLWSMCNTRISL